MSMYVDKEPLGTAGTRALDQGDILKDVLLSELPGSQSFGLRKGSSWTHELKAEQIVAEEGKNLRVMSKLTRNDYVIVLSNSCDNYGATQPLLLAPIRPFKLPPSPASELRKELAAIADAFVPKCSEAGCMRFAARTHSGNGSPVCDSCSTSNAIETTENAHAALVRKIQQRVDRTERQLEAEQWAVISRLATGANPKRFYLPGDAARGFERSEVHLPLAQPADPKYLTRCFNELGATRVFGLTHEATIHLQYTLNAFFNRNPRDDNSWPSEDDLRLKLAWLEEEIANGSYFGDDYRSEATRIRALLGMTDS